MRRDRRWAAWPFAVLLGTALALAPLQGAAAYAMEGDAAGGSPESVVTETSDDAVMPTVEAPVVEGAEEGAPPDPGPGFVPDGVAVTADELALELDSGGEVILDADIEVRINVLDETAGGCQISATLSAAGKMYLEFKGEMLRELA